MGVLVIFSFLVFLLLDDLPLFPNLWNVFSFAALQRPIPLFYMYVASAISIVFYHCHLFLSTQLLQSLSYCHMLSLCGERDDQTHNHIQEHRDPKEEELTRKIKNTITKPRLDSCKRRRQNISTSFHIPKNSPPVSKFHDFLPPPTL